MSAKIPEGGGFHFLAHGLFGCTLFVELQWATKVLRHFVIFEYLRQISFLISRILPPPPFSMLNFLSLEFASFLYNIEKGGGGLALNIDRI